jgi:U3 small nucleolar ribonucleoprotein component
MRDLAAMENELIEMTEAIREMRSERKLGKQWLLKRETSRA